MAKNGIVLAKIFPRIVSKSYKLGRVKIKLYVSDVSKRFLINENVKSLQITTSSPAKEREYAQQDVLIFGYPSTDSYCLLAKISFI